ncbi:MAG TPA: YCF48-related protein [Candidatus Binatia bacterium]|nr:YCF48-related protein [Candidatus Binatia bacterium]
MCRRLAFVVLLPWFASARVWAAPPAPDRIADNLYGTSFASDHDGWVVGAFGTIYRTRDAGRTWRPQVSHTQESLFSVDFVDTDHGWAVGRSGTILHTDDGGETWAAQSGHTEQHLFRVDFVDPVFGIAVGDWGTILITTDGGATWEPRPLQHDVILNGVSLVGRDHAWVVGEAGTILQSTDAGRTWTEQHSGVDKSLFGVFFADEHRGWTVGIDGLILFTDDGGATWQVQNGSTEAGGLEQVGFAQAFDQPSLYSVAVRGDDGYAVGEIGAIFTSGNGGRTWKRVATPPNWSVGWLRDVSIVAGTHGAMVGAGGKRVMIADGQVDLSRESTHAAETVH